MKSLAVLVLLLTAVSAEAQTTLEKIGQTPGGSGYHVNYDSTSQRLFVGCGGSIRMYDATLEDTLLLIGHRAFHSLVNETYVHGDILFVAANHDGFWALDITQPDMPVLGHSPTEGNLAAFDIDMYGDTLYFADRGRVTELTFSRSEGFRPIRTFAEGTVICVERRKDLIAVGSRIFLAGKVDVFNAHDVSSPLASWSDNLVAHLEDLQFADRNDSIIYLCGGYSNLATRGEFWGLRFTGSSLDSLARYTINGFLPGIASADVINMDSRNDTLYLATMAGLHNLETDVPVLDATGLPHDSLRVIGHIRPGLWHFDVSLADGTDYLAISSEWIGFIWRKLDNPVPWDTSEVYKTGGWGNSSRIRGDTLWVAMEGYGLAAYLLDDLYYSSGYIRDQEMLNIFTQFVASFVFVDDTLVWLSNHEIYNLTPWHEGGNPLLAGKAPGSGIGLGVAETVHGKRVVSSTYNPLASIDIGGELRLYDPYDTPDFPLLHTISVEGAPNVFTVEKDSVWVGMQVESQWSVGVYVIEADTFRLAAHAPAPGKVYCVSKDGCRIAVACKLAGVAWYSYDGDAFTQEGSLPVFSLNAVDVKVKNHLLYIAEQKKGLLVYDISDPAVPVLLATSSGSGGWDNAFGSHGIDVGADGSIYLTDFHVGTMIIEAVDTALVSVAPRAAPAPAASITVHPHPVGDYAIFTVGGPPFEDVRLQVYDALGRRVLEMCGISHPQMTVPTAALQPGIYLFRLTGSNAWVTGGMFVKK
ncbi:MAG: hypothetical protein JXA28_00880 [Bacteroidetes bacterium]|nr:hypothetical protein [Bacteroidota bacterium]